MRNVKNRASFNQPEFPKQYAIQCHIDTLEHKQNNRSCQLLQKAQVQELGRRYNLREPEEIARAMRISPIEAKKILLSMAGRKKS